MRENCITGEVIKNISKYMIKNKFLRMLSFQYATKWKDTYCDALKDSFTIIDTDQDGVISEDEFIEGNLHSPSNQELLIHFLISIKL